MINIDTKDKLIALLKAEHIREGYGCKCHSVEKLAEQILATLKVKD